MAKVLVRPAIGLGTTIDEGMKRCEELDCWDALMTYLRKHYDFLEPTGENVRIQHYGFDDRIDWDTYLLTVDGKAVLFMNGNILDP